MASLPLQLARRFCSEPRLLALAFLFSAYMPPPPAPPHGQEFLNLAKVGDIKAMEPILRANPDLLTYNGKVRYHTCVNKKETCNLLTHECNVRRAARSA